MSHKRTQATAYGYHFGNERFEVIPKNYPPICIYLIFSMLYLFVLFVLCLLFHAVV